MRRIPSIYDRYERLALKLSHPLLVYRDERGGISHCLLTHPYTVRWNYLGIVEFDEDLKKWIYRGF